MKKFDEEEKKELMELVDRIERNPLTLRIKEEEAIKTLAIRRETAEKIKQLKEEEEANIPILEAEVAAQQAELAQHEEKGKIIKNELAGSIMAVAMEKQRFRSEIGQSEIVLLSTYDERIDTEISFYRDHHEKLLRQKPDIQTRKGKRNLYTETQEMTIFSNAKLIQNALANCLGAIRELESMKFLPVLDMERVETLRRGLPDVGESLEISGEKPFPRINTNAPTKTDSQMAYELERLDTKFKKVMGRPNPKRSVFSPELE